MHIGPLAIQYLYNIYITIELHFLGEYGIMNTTARGPKCVKAVRPSQTFWSPGSGNHNPIFTQKVKFNCYIYIRLFTLYIIKTPINVENCAVEVEHVNSGQQSTRPASGKSGF